MKGSFLQGCKPLFTVWLFSNVTVHCILIFFLFVHKAVNSSAVCPPKDSLKNV